MRRARTPEAGFGLPELLVATVVVLVVTTAAGALAMGVQRVAVSVDGEQAARMDASFVLATIVRTLEQAGSFPYGPPASVCGGGREVAPLVLDPNGDGRRDAVRVRMDVNPPNGLLGGVDGQCDESGEDVVIALDRRTGAITRRDAASEGRPVAMSEARVLDLRFTCRDATGVETALAPDVMSVDVELTFRVVGVLDPRPRVMRATVRLRER